jgi:hypothetical protein
MLHKVTNSLYQPYVESATPFIVESGELIFCKFESKIEKFLSLVCPLKMACPVNFSAIPSV